MINYRAIEQAEATLDRKIAAATDPVQIASGKLKRAILRGWAIWVTEYADEPGLVFKGGARVIGDLILELALNVKRAGVNDNDLTAALVSLVLARVNEGYRDGGILVEMELDAKPDV